MRRTSETTLGREAKRFGYGLLAVMLVCGTALSAPETKEREGNAGPHPRLAPLVRFPSMAAVDGVLPPNAGKYVTIVYAIDVDPKSVRAILNDEDVTGLLSPRAGEVETVEMPLSAGENVLKLWAKMLRDKPESRLEAVPRLHIYRVTYSGVDPLVETRVTVRPADAALLKTFHRRFPQD